LETLVGKVVIVNSLRQGVRLIGELIKKEEKYLIKGLEFIEKSEKEGAKGSHFIVNGNYRRHAPATYGIKDKEEFEIRNLYYIYDDEKAKLLLGDVNKILEFPASGSFNRDDTI